MLERKEKRLGRWLHYVWIVIRPDWRLNWKIIIFSSLTKNEAKYLASKWLYIKVLTKEQSTFLEQLALSKSDQMN